MAVVQHIEGPGMVSQGSELDITPRRLRKGWERPLGELLDGPDFNRVYVGARLFTRDARGIWTERP